ncbi:MAG: STAS domain-containing protein [Chitinophagales bacterium]
MEYTIEKKQAPIALIALKGRLIGDYQVVDLKDDIDELIGEGYVFLIFELSHLEFINSTGLNFFLKVLTKVRRHDGEVVLTNLNETLNSLMVITKLNSFFVIENSGADPFLYFKEKGTIQ